jgi:propanol-preferring alcohol dehydrogenase
VAHPDYIGHLPDKLSFTEAAPVLCAGVTVYKGLKETEVKPGEWVVISGIGGLGHMAVQYAKAMGMHVIAVDIDDSKLKLASALGAEMAINAMYADPVDRVQKELKGAYGVLVTAVSRSAFAQGVGMLHRRGTMALLGLPPGDFPLNIFDVVLSRKTIRGSIVGTREDLAESLEFAAEGKVKAHYTTDKLENINHIFEQMEQGKIDGRIVMEIN